MSNARRSPVSLLVALLGSVPVAAQTSPRVDDHQVLWQRSLEDALALAKAEDRPLLIAVNMDGESASDRIVHENYRDPAFVAASRACVCVVASLFRHSPNDYDEHGRRIPCPRLGEVTCGEHIALEPLLFAKYLADGERVAPRHALIRQDGSKAFDLSLCFDLRDIDRALFAAVAAERARRGTLGLDEPPPAETTWLALAARRDQGGRLALEAALAARTDSLTLHDCLLALSAHGDAGSLDALRLLGARAASLSPAARQELVATASALGVQAGLAQALRTRVQNGDGPPGLIETDSGAALLPLLADLDGGAQATRSFLLACRALAEYGDAARTAVARALGAEAGAAVDARLAACGGAYALASAMQAANAVTRTEPIGALPRPNPIGDQMPEVDALERQLDECEQALRTKPDDATLHARFGKASLDLGRRRLDAQQKDASLLFEDAERHLRRALELDPKQRGWWIERARAAYFLTHFDDQIDFGWRAFTAAQDQPSASPQLGALPDAAVLEDHVAIEALRWVGDGAARQLAARAGRDPAVEIGGIHVCIAALTAVAVSPYATAQDWTSLASACGALGLWREELAILTTGAKRLPTDRDLRQAINAALWNLGRIDRAPVLADTVASAGGASADAAWFSGYARLLAAEDQRRREEPELALLTYADAAAAMERASGLNPLYAPGCAQQIAFTWLGRGFAHARAGRQQDAADCLVRAVTLHADLADARDGLGYDVLDLVDKALEWRAGGASPVRPLELLDRLDAVAPDTPAWALAIADSCLREALRADGRNPERVPRATVDAAGNKITMPMGLPTEEGDAYLDRSMAAARRARSRAPSPEDRDVIAQGATIWAERKLERGRLDGVRDALTEAAEVLGEAAPATDAGEDALRQLASRLRDRLGDARPRQRPGR